MAVLGEPIWPDIEFKTVKIGNQEWNSPVNWQEDFKWLEEQLRNQPDTVKGYILSFPMADGAAYYKVTKLRPLTVSPIMTGDRWEIPYWQIEGLTRKVIEELLQRNQAMRSLFGSRE